MALAMVEKHAVHAQVIAGPAQQEQPEKVIGVHALLTLNANLETAQITMIII